MKVSVAICTWNRATFLEKALDALGEMDIPSDIEWELIVVDNNSADDTEKVVRSFETKLPIRYEFESRQGKSHALNLAVSVAQGEYIIWTDDDAKVDKGWLGAYVSAFKEWPDAAFFGGPVRPWYETEPPIWLKQIIPRVRFAYALLDYGADTFELTWQKVPYGVNMAVKTEVQKRFLYDTELGPRPNSQLRGEGVLVVHTMMDNGYYGQWIPGAIVHHYIPAERQTVRYLRAYYRGQGEFRSIAEHFEGPHLFGKPRHAWRKAILGEIEFQIKRLIQKPENWVEPMIRSSLAWGLLFSGNSRDR